MAHIGLDWIGTRLKDRTREGIYQVGSTAKDEGVSVRRRQGIVGRTRQGMGWDGMGWDDMGYGHWPYHESYQVT
jgi:hypothetical protein